MFEEFFRKRRFNKKIYNITAELYWCVKYVADKDMDLQKIIARFNELSEELKVEFEKQVQKRRVIVDAE